MESDRRILLLGPVKGGKSSTGNSLIGFPFFQIPSKTCEMIKRKSDTINKHVWIVNTPGFCSQGSTPRDWAIEILRYLEDCTFKPHAFLLIFSLNDGAADQHKIISMLKLAFGEQLFRHCIVVFTHSDIVTATEESSPLQMIVDKCNGRFSRINNSASNVSFNIPVNDVHNIMMMVDQVSEFGKFKYTLQIERIKALEECENDDDVDALCTSVDAKISKMKNKPIAITSAKYIAVMVATGVVFYCTKESIRNIIGRTASEVIQNRNLILENRNILGFIVRRISNDKILPAELFEGYEGSLQTGIKFINTGVITALLTSALLKMNPLLWIAGITWGLGTVATAWI